MKPTLEEVKARYPIGTEYKCTSIGNEYIVESHNFRESYMENQFFGEDKKGCLWKEGKWAKIISLPQQDLIVGKWYKWLWTANNNITFGKIEFMNSDIFSVSEGIHSGVYSKVNGYYYNDCENIQLLTDLSEIQQYLPEGHPDKIEDSWLVRLDDNNRKVVTDWVLKKTLRTNFSFLNGYHYGMKKGEFYCNIDNHNNNIKVISTEEFYNKIGYKSNDMFNKGDYIVTLEGTFDITDCAKQNYCFKQRITSEWIEPEVDLKGNTKNNNQTIRFDKSHEMCTNWRYATLEEEMGYNTLGKPFDVTTLNKVEELTELPKKWCVKSNDSTLKTLFDFVVSKGYHPCVLDSNYYFHFPFVNSVGSLYDNIRAGYTEITFEQFEKWVLKKEQNIVNYISNKESCVIEVKPLDVSKSINNVSTTNTPRNINFILDEDEELPY